MRFRPTRSGPGDLGHVTVEVSASVEVGEGAQVREVALSPYREYYAHVGDTIDFTALVELDGLWPRGTYGPYEVPPESVPWAEGGVSVEITLVDPLLVTNTSDSGLGSLRYAIETANNIPGPNTIRFAIPQELGDSQIVLSSPLPDITDPVIIDATTQPGFAGTPIVQLVAGLALGYGAGGAPVNGLTIMADGSTVRGLLIDGFSGNGVEVAGSQNELESNVIKWNGQDGVEITGSGNQLRSNIIEFNRRNGVRILGVWGASIDGARANVIGTDGDGINDASEGNVISGNFESGVLIDDDDATDNVVAGNFIGTDASGTAANPNQGAGVTISGGSSKNRIGTDGDGVSDDLERNVISGNLKDGVAVEGLFSERNVVAGNFIGTDVSGTMIVWNVGHGVEVRDGAARNRIGAPIAVLPGIPWRGNLISGNGLGGVLLSGNGTAFHQNEVVGNRIGTDFSGLEGLGNFAHGIVIDGADGNRVERNLISANRGDGIRIVEFSDLNFVQANYIGTDATGTRRLGNAAGVLVGIYAAQNWIQDNLISANNYGVILQGPVQGSAGVYGNLIGTDVTGTKALGNLVGVWIDGHPIAPETSREAFGNEVMNNVISGNTEVGVKIDGVGAHDNQVAANYIGTDITGLLPLANGGHGIVLSGGANHNTVGGTTEAKRNLIAANNGNGVSVIDPDTSDNLVQGNYIGLGQDGQTALGNGGNGVSLVSAPSNTIGGPSPEAGNIIAGNSGHGVAISAAGNVVAGNRIGTDATGTVARPNANGVSLTGAVGNTIGGTAPGAGNLISGNTTAGVIVNGGGLSNQVLEENRLQGNRIGTDVTGTKALGNGTGVSLGSAPGNIVGGSEAGAGNLISGNRNSGVLLSGTADTQIQGNLIGVTADGRERLGNGSLGISVSSGSDRTLIGGTEPGAGNIISGNGRGGVRLFLSADVVVQGNFIGTDASGTVAIGNTGNPDLPGSGYGAGIAIESAPRAQIGGTEPGAGNVISSNLFGVMILGLGPGVNGNRIEGNLIGTDASGSRVLGNVIDGVLMTGDNTLGGSDPAAANVIAGSGQFGIVFNSGIGNRVLGNFIGTDRTVTLDLGNGSAGILIRPGSSSNQIGAAGAGNVIAFNKGAGIVVVDPSSAGNSIRFNAIHDNTGLGIDLGGDGLTVNDAGDLDIGPNSLQNKPVLVAVAAGSQTRVVGRLESSPWTSFMIDLYASSRAHPSGYGDGARWLGAIAVTTDATGTAPFDFSAPAATAAGEFVTATATAPSGDTSEFSGAMLASGVQGDDLIVGGGPGDDAIGLAEGSVVLTINGVLLGHFYPTGQVSVHALGGDDTVLVDPAITLPMTVDGGDGNDTLEGGGGDNTLIGGHGDTTFLDQGGVNTIVAGAGQNVLIPGGGQNQYVAPAGRPALVLTARPATRLYGQTNPAFNVDYQGFVDGDSPATLVGDLVVATDATPASEVGSYYILPGGLSSDKYSILFIAGTLTIDRAHLIVTADSMMKRYGEPNPPLTYTLSGFVNGDTAAVVTGTADLHTTATETSGVGSYPITAGVRTLTAANYDFPTGSFIGGMLTITKAATSITLASSTGSPLFGVDTLTLMAGVTVVAPGAGTPTGYIEFLDEGGTPLARVDVAVGATTLGLEVLTPGSHTLRAIFSGDENFLDSSAMTAVTVVAPSSLSGLVYEDLDNDGQVDFGERGIVGVPIRLTGTDDLGRAVDLAMATDDDGAYVFQNLRPGHYTITETQPAGYAQGINTVGTGGGTVSGDQFAVDLAADVAAMNYNFGERPWLSQPVHSGQAADIGFWNNKNGQALIKTLNGGVGTQLGDWLAANFPNVFGSRSGRNDLTGKSNAEVATFYQSRFVLKEKLDVQVLATALAVYVTDVHLNPSRVGSQYGFIIDDAGLGSATFNVGSNGAAFGVADGTKMTVMDLLLAADSQAVSAILYNGNATRRTKAKNVFAAINQAGGIVQGSTNRKGRCLPG